MEGCCTISISKKQSYLFPTLLRLSTKELPKMPRVQPDTSFWYFPEVVDIWDVVSAYILGQMKLDKGVLVPGLGTFAVVREQVNSTEEVFVVRRPVFQLDMDMSCLRELVFPAVMIPGDIMIMPLDYWWLSQTNSLPPDVVRGCVEETILLYSFQLRDRQRPTFAFENIGILSCQDNVLCMQFHCSCITGLEIQDTWVALLLTRLSMPGSGVSNGVTTAQGVQAAQAHMFPRFQLAVSDAFSTQHTKAAEKHRVRTELPPFPGEQEHPGKFSLLVLPYRRPGMRQQEPRSKPPASVLTPCPASSPRMREAGGQELAPSARPDITLLASENCQRALQEISQLYAEWEHGNSHWREQKVEWAAWEAWAAGEDQQMPQVFGIGGAWAPHCPSQPPRKGVTVRRGMARTPLPTEKMAEIFQPGSRHLSPRAIQVLHGLEPHQTQRNIFMFLAENNRRRQGRQEQQRQFCRTEKSWLTTEGP
ncbi:coiled-coil domain-containing protein 81-like isoform X1 [Vidua macroura]|uniref:coiled-coil domain-containing protein 81-like isoform X1 n=2 Tax=Vidua macroura TaxID=187451 RepID=UPI0023A8E0BD|nr:coiled-coil domain-containing protein 81-like isoform X1 [Vidua macroura]